MRLINTKFDTYKNHLILSNIYIQNIANGIYRDHLCTITTIWLMARDKLFVTYIFKGGSESGLTAVIWLVRGLHVIISSNFSFTWEPFLTQEAHRKEAELLKYFGLKSSPAWAAFKRECVVLVNLPTERLREKQLPSQPAKELSHPWQTVRWHTSPDDGIPQWKLTLMVAGAWAGASTLQRFCSFLWLHQMWPHTRCHQPYPNLSHSQRTTMSITQERKTKPSPSLWSQRNERLCTFLQLGESLNESLPFIFSGPYPTSPLQVHFHFFFPSTGSSQGKAGLSLPFNNLPHAQPCHSFIQQPHVSRANSRLKLKGVSEKRGRKRVGPLMFGFILFFCNFNQRLIIF